MKDWTGNINSIYKTLGASNHTNEERAEHDYYATDPRAAELLCELESFPGPIWECACGEGHLSEVLKAHGYEVYSSDLIDRGYGAGNVDFLTYDTPFYGSIVTNPPYKYAAEFVEHAMDILKQGSKCAMFLKLTFLESVKRRALFEKYPPKYVYVASKRLVCAKNGEFHPNENGEPTISSAVAYAWFVWEKGYKGEPTIRWFN